MSSCRHTYGITDGCRWVYTCTCSGTQSQIPTCPRVQGVSPCIQQCPHPPPHPTCPCVQGVFHQVLVPQRTADVAGVDVAVVCPPVDGEVANTELRVGARHKGHRAVGLRVCVCVCVCVCVRVRSSGWVPGTKGTELWACACVRSSRCE